MSMTPFVKVFREQGEKETRVMTIRGYPGLPDDEYALIEAYCTDPKCDCRRVMLNLAGRQHGSGYLASVGFGFDRNAAMAGPYLDPLNPQSRYAGVLFPLVQQVLADPAYVARLEAHYNQIKRACAGPQDPAHEMVRQAEKRREAPLDRKAVGARKTAIRKRKKRRKM